jgi:hypothetical protein
MLFYGVGSSLWILPLYQITDRCFQTWSGHRVIKGSCPHHGTKTQSWKQLYTPVWNSCGHVCGQLYPVFRTFYFSKLPAIVLQATLCFLWPLCSEISTHLSSMLIRLGFGYFLKGSSHLQTMAKWLIKASFLHIYFMSLFQKTTEMISRA